MKTLKKFLKNFVFVLLYYLFIKILVFQCSLREVSAITEQQRLEIEKLKSELSAALESDSENVAAQGVIVQPAWTQSADKVVPKEAAKVEVTDQNRKEAEALRAEIGKAVVNDKYATSGAAKTQDIKALEASLSMKEKGKDVLLTMMGSQRETEQSEQVGADSDDNEDLSKPNIITANLAEDNEIDIRKLQRLELSKRRTREMLILKYIEEDFSFNLGSEVNEWKHIVHAGQEYFIGRRLTDLLIVRKDMANYEQAMVVHVGQLITDIEAYTYWNLEQQQQEGVILIATGDKVLWYRAENETKQIELYWDWLVGNTITGLSYFTLDSQDYLIITSNQSSLAGYYALNIYQYKLHTKEFWIVQRLQLANAIEKVTVLNTGRDVILAIPQNNSADIYTFNPHEAAFSHIRFQLKRQVLAEGILTIAGFKMGGRSYLALTGYQPQILLYQQGDFVSKTILGSNFGLVELFFPIPVRTYRDDLILLVQHRVDFSSHILTVVETLIWDGEAFESSIPVPCHLGDHVVFGVACMLDLHRDEGLKGAALLRNGDDISVIVPRYQAESGLFRFHTELLAKNSELLDLQEIFDFLKDWVKEQDDLVAQAQHFLQIPNEDLIKLQPDLTHLESVRTPEFEFNGDVGEIYVNDYKWQPEDSNIDLDVVIQNIEDLEVALFSGRQRRDLEEILHDELMFNEVIVEHLEVENVNGKPFFIQNGELDFEGLINLTELEVLAGVAQDSQNRQANEEDFVVEGDLEFEMINGVLWSDIQDNLVFRTQNQFLKELEVKGEIIVENNLHINTLNALEFPNDFMLSSGLSTTTVKAEKHFANILSASAVDTNSINGKNPADAITLTDDQEWRGMPTFKQLEVKEILEQHVQVHGRNMNTSFENPTLQEANIIEADCYFQELIVNGPVVLRGKLDQQPLGLILKDILLKSPDPNEEILVPSLKTFDLVMFPTDFQLADNTINQIPAQNFVTVHTKQSLNITTLEGYVYFYNLTINGTYDGVKLAEVLRDIILVDKPLDLSNTKLIFENSLNAKSLTILDKLNGEHTKNNLQTLQEDLVLPSAEFDSLETLQANFFADILGQGKLNNIELHELVKEKSWHDPPIRGNIFLKELVLLKGLHTDELHGIKSEYLLDFLDNIDELPEMVLNGQIIIDHIQVTGDVQLHKLNGLLFDKDIQLTTIKLNLPNYLSTKLIFKNRLDVKGHLKIIADYRGNYLPDIIDDIVIKTANSSINIKAPKSFLKPIKVLKNTQVKALNGVPLENLALKNKNNHFKGSLEIKGNLVVRDLNLQGNINDFHWPDLQRLLYFDAKLDHFVLRNTIDFKTPQFLEDLTVLGDLNDIPNLTDFFKNLIYKDQICLLKGNNIFTGRVSIDKGAYISNLNGHDLEYLFKNLVFINSPQPVIIQAPVIFEQRIQANEIQVKQTLEVESLNGCSIREWLNNSLRVDQDLNITHFINFAAGSLDGNSFAVQFLKDIDLSRIITLNTVQTFNETVTFSDVFLTGSITAKGRVNNVNLEQEYNNTFMTYGHQHISTPLTIQTIVVLNDLTVRAPVNSNKNLQDVATLEKNLVLESPIYLQSIYSPQVIMHDLATGIDFNKWFTSAVKNQDPNAQYILGNWTAKYLTVKSGPQNFQYPINGFEPWQYYSFIRTLRSDNWRNSENENICQLIKDIWQFIANKSVYIKYIEENYQTDVAQHVTDIKETLRKIFYLKSLDEQLLLINFQCQTLIFKWLEQEQKFILKNSFKSGPIDQIEVVPGLRESQKLEFITTVETLEEINCSLEPTNKWKIHNDSIVLEKPLPQPLGGSFYANVGSNFSLLKLYNETLMELDLDSVKVKQTWPLPLSNTSHYRFVPSQNQQEVLLTNGEQLVLLKNNLDKNLKKSTFYTTQPRVLQTFQHFPDFKPNSSESILKPKPSLARSFVFDDFKQVVERILIDLAQRLQQEINITQLSIPESDLFDEHLVPDFVAIMEELKRQNIFPSETFNIDFENIIIPRNPAQVLAARVVQISWPVIKEIEEIHFYLRTNKTHDHPLCSCIIKSLGFLIKDVLMLANPLNATKDVQDYSLDLIKVIERIRVFENDLKEFVKALTQHQEKPSIVEQIEKRELHSLNIKRDFQPVPQYREDLMFVENSHLPGYQQGEILSLQVGSKAKPLRLWAVTNTKTSLAALNNPGIFLYLEDFKEQLYQVIAAVKPRSLQQLRIKQETFLLYIEDCCQLKVLRYLGSQGFQKFAELSSKEYIKQILTLSLASTPGNIKYFIVALMDNNIKFYEFVVEGWNFESPFHLAQIPSNCL